MSGSEGRRPIDRVALWLLGIAVVALAMRLFALGDRIAHWDEGRVGYDILRYMATGAWEYRPIVHGPFLPQVNKHVFAFLGASDFSMRLVVAVVGGLLPLAAWLYRDHLRDVEVLALGVFLAIDPVLVYYSRFMRNDVLVAAFAFAAFGFYLRLYGTGRSRYLFAGTGSLALAFTAKENAILYVACVLGGLVLLFDHRLFLAREAGPDWLTLAWRRLRWAWRGVRGLGIALPVAAIEFLTIIVVFFAPRAGETGGIGLWRAFGQPGMFPSVIEAATVGAVEKVVRVWGSQDHPYLPFLYDYLEVLVFVSGGIAALAVVGFLSDRYTGDRPRDLIALGFYWGAASVAGYPIATDIKAAWVVTHAVVPLAIPAAAAVGRFVSWGRDALLEDDRVAVGLVAVVLVLLGGQLAATTVTTSYLNPQREGNLLIQFAQPEGEFRPTIERIQRAARNHDGLDVVWYGDHYLVENESDAYRLPVSDGEWYHRLPLPWYLERANATVNSTADRGRLLTYAEQGVPVIITRGEDDPDITLQLRADYRRFEYEARQFGVEFVFYVREDAP